MYKLIIINQHRSLPGKKIQELYDHLDSYINYWCEGVFMFLKIDQMLTDGEIRRIVDYNQNHPNKLSILYDDQNIYKGLSPSRCTAYNAYVNSGKYDATAHVMFGCTNCVYIYPLEELVANLTDHRDIILVPCEYENSVQKVSNRLYLKTSYTFDEYFNAVDKPDYTLILPGVSTSLLHDLEGNDITERYYPEEIYIHRILYFYQRNILKVADKAYQHCWYNKGGLSESFNRLTMIESRHGFSERARYFLSHYMSSKLTLSYDKLKNLVYEYVTLSDKVDTKWLKGTMLEPMVYYALQHWVDNESFHHSFTFNENKN